MTLAAVAKCLQAATWLVARGNKFGIFSRKTIDIIIEKKKGVKFFVLSIFSFLPGAEKSKRISWHFAPAFPGYPGRRFLCHTIQPGAHRQSLYCAGHRPQNSPLILSAVLSGKTERIFETIRHTGPCVQRTSTAGTCPLHQADSTLFTVSRILFRRKNPVTHIKSMIKYLSK